MKTKLNMPPQIEENRQRLTDLCTRHEVRQLELFGSVARGDFDTARSDFDFLVAFHRKGVVGAADRYMGLLMGLEELLGRKVDLVDIAAARNPYFIAEALKHRVVVYAA